MTDSAEVEMIYHAILKVIDVLMTQDPPRDSPEGRLLDTLVDIVDDYEKAKWPLR